MKKTFLIFSLLCIAKLCCCQITKNTWMTGGGASFSNTNINNGSETNVINIAVSPNVGYFLINKFALGSRLSFTSDYSPKMPIKTNFYTIGPFIRYYLLAPEKTFNIYAQTSYEIKLENKRNGAIRTFSALGGPVIFFNPNVALEFNLGYATTNFKNNDLIINTFQSGISLQIHLNK